MVGQAFLRKNEGKEMW